MREKKTMCEMPEGKPSGTECLKTILPNKKKGKLRKISLPDTCRGVSLSAFRKASLTVEASFAIPLFFLAALSVICMTGMYSSYAEKAVKLREQAETAAVAAFAAGDISPSYIDLSDGIEVRPRWYPAALPAVTLTVRARVRAWTGRKGEEASAAEKEDEEMVYVSEHESVYHTSSSCTHLNVSVKSADGRSVTSRRNAYGERYHACEKCVGSGAVCGTVYITDEGDHFHNSASCSGLKRTVRLVRRSETDAHRLCGRCAAGEAA